MATADDHLEPPLPAEARDRRQTSRDLVRRAVPLPIELIEAVVAALGVRARGLTGRCTAVVRGHATVV